VAEISNVTLLANKELTILLVIGLIILSVVLVSAMVLDLFEVVWLLNGVKLTVLLAVGVEFVEVVMLIVILLVLGRTRLVIIFIVVSLVVALPLVEDMITGGTDVLVLTGAIDINEGVVGVLNIAAVVLLADVLAVTGPVVTLVASVVLGILFDVVCNITLTTDEL
jgi:hypothetical protein